MTMIPTMPFPKRALALQLFLLLAPTLAAQEIFSDGFETGDCSAWSVCVGGPPDCPLSPCTVVTTFPFQVDGDTTDSPLDDFDSYSCDPAVELGGPEDVYLVSLPAEGTLVASVEGEGTGEDLDVVFLAEVDPLTCLVQGDRGASTNLSGGTALVVVDSRSSGPTTFEGAYTLNLHHLPVAGNCGLAADPVDRPDAPEPLPMPATGSVATLGHLVTEEEWTGQWPSSIFDGVEDHWAISESATGYVMNRTEPWRSADDNGNFGQGTGSRPPATSEGWYATMLWSDRPAEGTRLLAFDGRTGLAVVVAGGYDDGPADLTEIGGLCEEVHDYLETDGESHVTLGFTLDQELPFGPIACEQSR